MSLYGLGIYGLSKYGAEVEVGASSVSNPTYRVTDLSAVSAGTGSIRLEYTPPSSDEYTEIAVVRSRFGIPVAYDDGEVIYQEDGPLTISQALTDSGLVEGRFYYYAIFILVDSDWIFSGGVVGLSVQDWDYDDYFYNLIPRVYKAPMNELTDPGVDFENTQLRKFVNVFGFSLDTIRTEYELVSEANNAAIVKESALEYLGAEIGVLPEPSISAYLNRQRVRTASYVYRQKGTELGLRNALNAATGWDVEFVDGINLMLSRDQSRFYSPRFPDWDGATRYETGARVLYGSITYQALADTIGEEPTLFPLVWDAVSDDDSDTYTTRNPITGGYSSWEQFSYDVTVDEDPNNLVQWLGTAEPTEIGGEERSVLAVYNSGDNDGDIGVRHIARVIGADAPDRGQVAIGAIPFKVEPLWNSLGDYAAGDVVRYGDWVFEAAVPNSGVTPPTTPVSNEAWRFLSSADSNTYTASAYFKQIDQDREVEVTIEWYDQYGNLLATAQTDYLTSYDGFDYQWKDRVGSAFSQENDVAWTDADLIWMAADGGAFPDPDYVGPPAFRKAITTAFADCNVGLTFRTATAAGSHGLLVRYQNDSNHWRVTRDHLIQVQSGTPTVRASWTALEDDERIVVKCAGNNIEVYRYVSVDGTYDSAWELEFLGGYTSTFNNSQITYGIFEAD